MKSNGSSWLTPALLILVILGAVAPAHADPIRILETAVTDPAFPPRATAISVNDRQLIGTRFEVASPMTLLSVGGNFLAGSHVFAALVRLGGPEDFPDSRDLSTSDVRGVTQIRAGGQLPDLPFVDATAPLGAELDPGWYAIVFGGGLFGVPAGVTAGFSWGHAVVGDPSFITSSAGIGPRGPWTTTPPNGIRVFADADLAPIPEPSTCLLVTAGTLWVLRRHRHHRRG